MHGGSTCWPPGWPRDLFFMYLVRMPEACASEKEAVLDINFHIDIPDFLIL